MSDPTTSPSLEFPERYRAERQIGRGGMGTVWRVLDRHFDRPLAIKLIRPELSSHAESRARFEREAKVTGQLQHPGIPPIVDRGALPDGTPYFSMKLIEGETFADMLRASEPADLPRRLHVFEQVCQAVGFAHSKGIIHRDLKPANIMVGPHGEVQVMDWGMAKSVDDHELAPSTLSGRPSRPGDAANAIDETLSPTVEFDPEATTELEQTTDFDHTADFDQSVGTPTRDSDWNGESATLTRGGQVLGTLAYMPPEQSRGETQLISPQSDVFALGGTLCKILTGQAPYRGGNLQELTRKVFHADLADALADLDQCGADERLIALCRRCLAVDPAVRPADGSAVAGAVRDYQDSMRERLEAEQVERAAAVARSEEARKRQRITTVAAILVIALMGMLGFGIWWRHAENQSRLAREMQQRIAQQERERQATSDIELALERIPSLQVQFEFESAEALLRQAESRLDVIGALGELADQVAQTRKDLEMAMELDRIQLQTSELVDDVVNTDFGTGQDGPLATAYRNYGLDLIHGDPAELGAAIQRSEIAPALLSAMDAWRFHAEEALGERLARIAAKARGVAPLSRLYQEFSQSNADPLERITPDFYELTPAQFRMLISDASTQGDEPLVSELYRVALAIYPDDFWLNYNVAAIHHADFSIAEQIGHARVAAAIRPRAGGAYNNLGYLLYQNDQLNEAILALQHATRLDPTNLLAKTNLGVVMNRRSPGSGEPVLREVIAERPNEWRALLELGNIWDSQGKSKEAEEAYRTILASNPQDANTWSNLAILLESQQRIAEAEAAHEKALEFAPDSAKIHSNYGAYCQNTGALAKAENAYRRAIELEPNNADSHYNLGTLLHGRDALDEAEACYQNAVRLHPDHIDAWHNLSRTLFQQKKWSAAIEPFKTHIKLQRDDLTSHGMLGICLLQLGRNQEAMQAFQTGKSLCAPNSPELPIFENHIERLQRLPPEPPAP